ncbi:ATP-binding cassette domain-containing protein [Candidatus Saccharibacteria bacterium]|nr:ATP-binding cassette domain-containing protein [Candidatus Saccharibacteria bacterium]
MLEIRGVTKVYQTGGVKRTVLNKVSINFRESEFAAILGPSGSGKTTLLNIIGGLDKYTSGDLVINEKSTKKFRDKDWDAYRNHRVGFVFQSYNLIPHQTVLHNVRLALTLSGISKRESIQRAKKALKDVGLSEHVDKLPAQLSGGQMQRVAIARALVNDPDILLADEPTGALDSETSIQIMKLLKDISRKKLVVMVTHNPELADEYATRIINLKDGKITNDSNPYDGSKKTDLDLIEAEKKSKKTKMSFITAASLSLSNLLTKKARTVLVAVAGSIGIIGIALISAVSTGFQNYIDKIEEDTLTSYPLALQKETADMTGILLSLTDSADGERVEGKLKENQVLSSTLGTVSNNDLPSFKAYLDAHMDEVGKDIRLMEQEYNVDPLVYTIDATDKVAKMNPSTLFTSLVGESSLLRNYSSMTSVFQQYDKTNLENDTNLLAGRYPEEYNELMVVLSNEGEISDLLTYSLGFHDTDELNKIVSKIMSGENVEITNEPLELSYEDIMSRDLRLVPATETYRYNSKYDVYEDMSKDQDYMRGVYNSSEKLKIVGVSVMNSEMLSAGSGVAYLPSLVTHIIDKASETEIVKKQLANPEVDVFSGVKFGEEDNKYDFKFEDLVSVDEAALSRAFGVNIDQNAISNKTREYIGGISGDITNGVNSVPEVRSVLVNRFKDLAGEMGPILIQKIASGDIPLDPSDPEKTKEAVFQFVDGFVNGKDFSDLESSYGLPADNFKTAFDGLLKIYAFKMIENAMSGFVVDMDEFLNMAEVSGVFDALSTGVSNLSTQKQVVNKVSGLTSYLTSSFANSFHVDQSAIVGAFRLNFSEEELSRVVTAMFTKKKTTLATNLSALGYQDLDDPTQLSFYFWSFDGKTRFLEFLDSYNDAMRDIDDGEKVIEYTDTTGVLMGSVKTIVDAVSYVLIAFVSISLIVSSIMIGVITFISVYERTKEIGILRAIGASKHNISSIFNAETFIIGLLSGLFGVGLSYLLIIPINFVLHLFTGDIPLNAALDPRTAIILIVLSVVLTLIAGIIPSRSASKKDPVEALRSE